MKKKRPHNPFLQVLLEFKAQLLPPAVQLIH